MAKIYAPISIVAEKAGGYDLLIAYVKWWHDVTGTKFKGLWIL